MRLILVLLIASWTQLAQAKTIFEPSLSLGQGSGDVTIEDVTSSGDGTVATFGFRYGITRRYIHVTGIIEGNIFASEDADTEFLGFGGFGIGYEWNIPLRTYFIVGAYEFDTDLVGTGVELAYQFSDSLWVGLRYIDFQYQIDTELLNTPLSAKVSLNTISLVVSFPFEFEYPDHWFRKTDWQ